MPVIFITSVMFSTGISLSGLWTEFCSIHSSSQCLHWCKAHEIQSSMVLLSILTALDPCWVLCKNVEVVPPSVVWTEGIEESLVHVNLSSSISVQSFPIDDLYSSWFYFLIYRFPLEYPSFSQKEPMFVAEWFLLFIIDHISLGVLVPVNFAVSVTFDIKW